MTLVGTIVSYREGDKGRVVTYPSKADNDDLLKALFDGGEATLYACSDSTGKCLRMTQTKHMIPADKAFRLKVARMLEEITKKAINDGDRPKVCVKGSKDRSIISQPIRK